MRPKSTYDLCQIQQTSRAEKISLTVLTLFHSVVECFNDNRVRIDPERTREKKEKELIIIINKTFFFRQSLIGSLFSSVHHLENEETQLNSLAVVVAISNVVFVVVCLVKNRC